MLAPNTDETERRELHGEVATLREKLIEVLTAEKVMIGAAILACAQVGGSLIREYVAEKDRGVAIVDYINALLQQIESPQSSDDKCRRQLQIISLLTAGNSVDEQKKVASSMLGGVILTAQTKEKRLWMLSRVYEDMRKAIEKRG
jgi:hypothetical protein